MIKADLMFFHFNIMLLVNINLLLIELVIVNLVALDLFITLNGCNTEIKRIFKTKESLVLICNPVINIVLNSTKKGIILKLWVKFGDPTP